MSYVQKGAVDVLLPWGTTPVSLVASHRPRQVLTTDGNDGAIVAWGQGLQNGVNIFAQRVNSGGQNLWSNPA